MVSEYQHFRPVWLALALALVAACSDPKPAPTHDAVADASPADISAGYLVDADDDSPDGADAAETAVDGAGDTSPVADADAAAVPLPCLTVTPSGLDFGTAVPGGAANLRSLNLCNCGTFHVAVTGLLLTATQSALGEFAVNQDALFAANWLAAPPPVSVGNPLALAVGQCRSVGLSYQAVDLSAGPTAPDLAELAVEWSAPATVTVALHGLGVPSLCPQAVAQVSEGNLVVPQTNLHLQGKASTAQNGGSIAKYWWTVTQPPGTKQPVLANPAMSNPTLLANATGTYTFCLEVWDNKGLKSCAPSCQSVLVVPDVAVHIELLWDTPTDATQFDDDSGADLDLHFAHPLAAEQDLDCDGMPDPWFSNPWDTYWFNGTPQWGSADAAVKDDPTLDLDDTDGAGPENLNLAAPEGDLAEAVAYSVGVHYLNDHGYGTSLATLAFWIQGSQVVHLPNVPLEPLDMWYAGKLWWPNTATGGTKKVFETCHQAGLSCDAGKSLMWQPVGDYCITHCYANETFIGTLGGGAVAATCNP